LKHLVLLRLVVVLLGASLLAACGQAAPPSAKASVPTVSAPVPAPKLTVAPLATAVSKTSPASTTNRPEACTLLSKDDVSKILGQAVDEVKGTGVKGEGCTYKTKNYQAVLTISWTAGAKYIQQARAKVGEVALDVPGVGDQAFYNTGEVSETLFVGKGDTVFLFKLLADSTLGLAQADRIAMEKALATQALSHL
jgi:Protein of unknown function (DUF3558)